jgi:hypothetical protein
MLRNAGSSRILARAVVAEPDYSRARKLASTVKGQPVVWTKCRGSRCSAHLNAAKLFIWTKDSETYTKARRKTASNTTRRRSFRTPTVHTLIMIRMHFIKSVGICAA